MGDHSAALPTAQTAKRSRPGRCLAGVSKRTAAPRPAFAGLLPVADPVQNRSKEIGVGGFTSIPLCWFSPGFSGRGRMAP